MSSNQLVSLKLLHMFDQIPGFWMCKDINSRFIYANREFAHNVGVGADNHLKIIGETDADMPCETRNCADLFLEQDRKVMSKQKKLTILDVHPYAGNAWKAYVCTKVPLYDDKRNVIGVVAHGCDVTNTAALELGMLLSRIAGKMTAKSTHVQNSYFVEKKSCIKQLTEREEECLFFLIRGKSAKIIARILNISPRTVEIYVEHLKEKFNVSNKFDLIDAAIQEGFLSFIPKSLFNRQLTLVLNAE